MWALRTYPTVAVAAGRRPPEALGEPGGGDVAGDLGGAGWQPLSWWARWLLAVRLADVELCCDDAIRAR
jgi:hypothetical protein